ncbi:hypothetical protein [Rhodococcus kronopolitis]|uniref:ESX-1 secretion-associated protein n=1 Tax=Rhodococcus kronopolitis TaxID=1460226 RepID=A0ABV9FYW7_9NOCA
MGNSMTEWQSLGASVDSGSLYLEPGVAQRCAQRCSEFEDELRRLKGRAMFLSTIDGFGTALPTGVTLAAKFSKKASGGDYSLDQALADHITVVEQMRALFEKIGAAYDSADQSAADGIDSAGN